MIVILLTNLSMALFRAPTVALLGDLFPSAQRSTTNGIINLMGGIGALIAPFAFGSVVLLAAISMVLLYVKEPETKPESVKAQESAGYLTYVKDFLSSANKSGFYILMAILCWFLGWNA